MIRTIPIAVISIFWISITSYCWESTAWQWTQPTDTVITWNINIMLHTSSVDWFSYIILVLIFLSMCFFWAARVATYSISVLPRKGKVIHCSTVFFFCTRMAWLEYHWIVFLVRNIIFPFLYFKYCHAWNGKIFFILSFWFKLTRWNRYKYKKTLITNNSLSMKQIILNLTAV